MRKKGQRRTGECAYCGRTSELTREHVIPKSLFLSPLPSNMVTVPCCDTCNNTKSKDDDYLRDMIATDLFASAHPIAQQIFQENIIRSVQRNSSEIARVARTSARNEPFYTKNGLYLGEVVSVPVDGIRVNAMFARIIRGLFYKVHKRRIPDNYTFELSGYKPWDFLEVFERIKQMHMNGPYAIGDVFGCAFVYAQEDPFISLWLLWFYNGAFFSVSVNNPEQVLA